jgi:hypothetical protein
MMNTTTRKLAPLAGLATVGLLGAGLAQAAPASAAVDVCRVTIRSLEALDLQERGKDEVYLRLGDTQTQSLQYSLGQKRFNVGSDVFTGSEQVAAFEDDLIGDDFVDSTTLPCTNDFGTATLNGNGAIYRVGWTVAVI